MENTLTIDEALKQGYTKCANRNDEWTTVQDISDLIDEDFEISNWWLASKEVKTYQISDRFLTDVLSEQIAESEYEETGRDTDDIQDAITSLNFEPFTKLINDKLNEFNYYGITQIQLIK